MDTDGNLGDGRTIIGDLLPRKGAHRMRCMKFGWPGKKWTQLYNPATGPFRSTNNRSTKGRYLHTADCCSQAGKVLIAGGGRKSAIDPKPQNLRSGNVLCPHRRSRTDREQNNSATILQNGNVLVREALNAGYSRQCGDLRSKRLRNWSGRTGGYSPSKRKTATTPSAWQVIGPAD